jgi:phosphoribosylaminoimidazolecarboxamide formyltransferase/IMP cyclohydrolase
MVNFPVDMEVANRLRLYGTRESDKRLLDGVVAPSFSEEAKVELNRKGGKCRMLQLPALEEFSYKVDVAPRFRYVRGGFLVQPNYTYVLRTLDDMGADSHAKMDDYDQLILAWAVGSTSNSNTVTLVKNGMLIGNGVGQQDRIGAAKLAIERARRSGHDVQGAYAYSDSFFPFPDGAAVLADAGVQAILTSSGSINDEKVWHAIRERGVRLFTVPDAVGRGFFGH